MKRRFTLLAIAAIMSTTLMAQPSQVDGKYQIATKTDLEWLADQVNNGTSFSGQQFEQIADIDLGGIQDGNGVWSGTQWTPIGKMTKDADNKDVPIAFSGTYDGNGYVIKNLYFNNDTISNVGLFGCISGATLTKITIASGSIFGCGATSGICGAAYNSSTISYCTNNATVYARKEQNGGICGYLEKSKVTNCINYGLISGFNMTGGIVGRCKSKDKDKVYNCINVGQVFSMCATSGNIIGLNDGTTAADIQNCYYDNQMNTLGALTRNKSERYTTDNFENKIDGKNTSLLINGTALSGFSSDEWVFESGMYPRLKTNYNNAAIILAATPVTLDPSDKSDNVTKDFNVSIENEVLWSCLEPSSLTINDVNGSVTINKSTGIVIIGAKDSYTKKIFIKTNTGTNQIGSAENPLTIDNEEDLIKLRDAVNTYGVYKDMCAAYDGFKGIYFKVSKEIVLTSWNEPIGIHNSFKGVFDGNHQKISGINIDQPTKTFIGGLFGGASYGEIKNITTTCRESGKINGKQYVGGICGATFSETIDNCTSNCTININSNTYAGGIVGIDKGYSTLTNCKNTGAISGSQYIAGIMGASNMSTTFDGCKNYGSISSSADNIGGICGGAATAAGGCVFNNCENHASIYISADNKTNIGGIVGYITKNATEAITINNCINSGNITANGTLTKFIGGVVGHNDGTLLEVSNCLNIGIIKGGSSIGGILGYNELGTSNITNSLNAGETSGEAIVGNIKDENKFSCEKSINIGKATYSNYSNYCINDRQMCPSVGESGNATSNMLGSALESELGNGWTYTGGRYPIPSSLSSSYYATVASIPFILDNADNVNDVKANFVNIDNENITWACSSNIDFDGNYAYFSHSSTGNTPVTVTISMTIGNITYSKNIPLNIKKKTANNGPIIEWNIDDQISIFYKDPIPSNVFTARETNGYPGEMSYSVEKGGTIYSTNEVLNGGDYNLIATFTPSNTNIDAVSKSVALKVKPITPEITWDQTEPITIPYGTALTSTQLNASTTSGQAITYTLDSPTGSNAMNASLDADTYTIYANIAESNNYSAKSIQKSLVVEKATPTTIEWDLTNSDITYGDNDFEGKIKTAVAKDVNGNKINGTFSYSIPELVAGDNEVSATFNSTNYEITTPIKRTVYVAKATPTITWSNPSDITYGDLLSKTTQLNASAGGIEGSYSYTLENGSNAEGAKLDAGDNQKIHVLFSPDQNDAIAKNYESNTADVYINVAKATPTTIEWDLTNANITYGDTDFEGKIKTAVAKDAKGTIIDGTFSYNIPELIAGDNEVSATFSSKNYEITTPIARTVNVAKADPEIAWEPQGFAYGASEEVINSCIKTASATFNNVKLDGNFTYNIPTNLNAGPKQITITFTPDDSDNFNVATIKANITIAQATPVVTWDVPAEITITYGTVLSKAQLKATTNAIGQFSYLLTEGGNALDTILDAGTYVVKAVFSGSINYAQWEDSRTVIVEQAAPAITWEPNAVAWGASAEEIDSNVKNAVAKDAKGNVLEGEFTYVIPELTAVGEAEVSVTFENKNYKTASATTKMLNVTKANPVIAWTPQNITFGASVSEILSKIDNAQASYNGEEVKGAFEYDNNIPNLDAGTQNVTVKFTPQDGEKFNDVEETAELTIEKATPTIEWNPKAEIAFGTTLNDEVLNATANVEGSFTYEPTADSVLKVGSLKISAVFTPDNAVNYNQATAEVQINVTKATPVITWNTPEDITVGTALSAAQLNATANVEGDFVYTPAADAVLEVGEHQKLSVVFTPTDTENYNSASDSVFINVKATSSDTTQIDSTAAIVWAPSAIVYGTPVGETFNATAKIEGEITYSLAADSILNAGEYKVTAKLSPVNGNDTTIERIVKVAKAELTATAANDTIMQGDTMPTFEINYTGFVGNDNAASLTSAPIATCSASTDTVGSFEIVVSGGEAINYDFIHVNGLLTILAKGDTLPIDTLPIDTLPIDTTGVAIITWAPAVSTITYGTLIDSTILNATANVEGTFTYLARQVITIVLDTTVYALGEVDSIPTVDVASADSVGEVATVDSVPSGITYQYITRSLAIGDTLNPGTYELIATFVPADSTISAVNDTAALTVNKAVLKVSVADVAIKQFEQIPAFEVTYEGFVLGQNENDLQEIPIAKEQVSNTNEAGVFDIFLVCGLSDNYEFDYHNGKLTIVKQDDDVAINESAAIFEVYPNPSNGAFFVNAGDDAQEVRIFNSTGKLVKVENIEGVTRIDISEYANGIYFVKVGNQTKTIIKQ